MYVNETDFEKSELDKHAPGEMNFKAFVNQYIHYRYEPCDEDFEETRYFTRQFDENLMKKLEARSVRDKRVISIKLKN